MAGPFDFISSLFGGGGQGQAAPEATPGPTTPLPQPPTNQMGGFLGVGDLIFGRPVASIENERKLMADRQMTEMERGAASEIMQKLADIRAKNPTAQPHELLPQIVRDPVFAKNAALVPTAEMQKLIEGFAKGSNAPLPESFQMPGLGAGTRDPITGKINLQMAHQPAEVQKMEWLLKMSQENPDGLKALAPYLAKQGGLQTATREVRDPHTGATTLVTSIVIPNPANPAQVQIIDLPREAPLATPGPGDKKAAVAPETKVAEAGAPAPDMAAGKAGPARIEQRELSDPEIKAKEALAVAPPATSKAAAARAAGLTGAITGDLGKLLGNVDPSLSAEQVNKWRNQIQAMQTALRQFRAERELKAESEQLAARVGDEKTWLDNPLNFANSATSVIEQMERYVARAQAQRADPTMAPENRKRAELLMMRAQTVLDEFGTKEEWQAEADWQRKGGNSLTEAIRYLTKVGQQGAKAAGIEGKPAPGKEATQKSFLQMDPTELKAVDVTTLSEAQYRQWQRAVRRQMNKAR